MTVKLWRHRNRIGHAVAVFRVGDMRGGEGGRFKILNGKDAFFIKSPFFFFLIWK